MTAIQHPHIPVSPHEYVAISKLARITGFSQHVLKGFAATGKIPSLRSPGGHRRFPVGATLEAIQKMTQHDTPRPGEAA